MELCSYRLLAVVLGLVAAAALALLGLYWAQLGSTSAIFGVAAVAGLVAAGAYFLRKPYAREAELARLEIELRKEQAEGSEGEEEEAEEVEKADTGSSRREPETGRFQKKGGLQFKFAAEVAKVKDAAGREGASKNRVITIEEVRKHATPDDLWIVFRRKVYNVTPYMAFHPGGKAELMRCAGGDGTAIYNDIHPWVGINIIDMLQVGLLSSGNLDFSQPPPKTGAANAALSRDLWRSFELVHTEQISESLIFLRFSIGDFKVSGLRCGQHVDLKLKAGSNSERQYTPVSAADTAGVIEFVVKVYPSGKVGPALAKLKVGETVQMRGTGGHISYLGQGLFGLGVPESERYSEVLAKHVVMLGAGSGITPMIQILSAMGAEWKAGATLQVTVVSCSQREEDIIYRAEFERMAHEAGGQLRVRFLLSRPPTGSETWRPSKPREVGAVQHASGHISERLLRDALGSQQLGDQLVLCCGGETFTDAADNIFRKLGVPGARVQVF